MTDPDRAPEPAPALLPSRSTSVPEILKGQPMPTTEELRAAVEMLRSYIQHDLRAYYEEEHDDPDMLVRLNVNLRTAESILATPTAPTDERLAEIEAAANAATPGPWERDYCGTIGHIKSVATPDDATPTVCLYDIWHKRNVLDISGLVSVEQQVADGTFIAIARTAVPELLAAIRDQQRQLAESRAEVERLRADAERLDHLESLEAHTVCDFRCPNGVIVSVAAGQTLREAIDDARKE